ncbi:uncharacterized protein LODBEIA_P52650 [Lodderomyces beijingensis]|uniref:Anaphase-promoting complex subunit 13 n=1 Tax=Lodderomyces beijingensis TaxID=1775926 RepID=A0ABP0ZVC3_9ASCO
MKDGIYGYTLFSHPNTLHFMENWSSDPLQFDDIDLSQLPPPTTFTTTTNINSDSALDEENDLAASVNGDPNNKFAMNNLRQAQKRRWMDLRLHESFKQDARRFDDDLTLLPNIIDQNSTSVLLLRD